MGKFHNKKFFQKIRGYSWTLARALPKKSTLNVNRKITSKIPQLSPCYSSNIRSISQHRASVPAVPPSRNALHPDIHTACSVTLSDLCSKVTLTILHKTAQLQHTHSSILSLPSLRCLVPQHLPCSDIQNVCWLCFSPARREGLWWHRL